MLNGTLDTFDLGDVLSLLEKAKLTGALEVESADGRGVLFLVDGRFAGSGADEADPHPTSSSQFEAELIDACAALLGLESGEFRFVEGRTPGDVPRECLEIETVLVEARRAAAEWRVLAQSIPSLDAPVLVVPELPTAEILLDRKAWRVVALADGSRSVRDLAHDLARPMADVGRTVAELAEVGVLAFFEAPADPVLLADEPPAPVPAPAPVAEAEPAPTTPVPEAPPRAETGFDAARSAPAAWADAPAPAAWADTPTEWADPAPAPAPDPRLPRSVGELAAWAEPVEPAEPAPLASTYADEFADEADLGLDAYEPDGLPGEVEADDGDDGAHNDEMRRDRGALLRMFSALKE